MKRIFALILIIAMLIPFAVACGGGEETTTTTEIIDYDKFTSKDTVKKDWEGKTVLVAASSWSKNHSYPWSTMELVVKEGETSGWGEQIDKAVLERTAFIKKTYGVDVIWEWASRYNTHDVLANAILAGNDPDYDLASWVLGKFGKDDLKTIEESAEAAAKAAIALMTNGITDAMNKFNK